MNVVIHTFSLHETLRNECCALDAVCAVHQFSYLEMTWHNGIMETTLYLEHFVSDKCVQ